MITNINDTDEPSFVRHWSERVWDQLQLAHIAAIEDQLIKYAMTAWRPMNLEPPADVLLLTSCIEGVVLMTHNGNGDWRTSMGMPHKPPYAWMPCPPPANR